MESKSQNSIMQNRAIQRIPGMTQLLSKRPDRFSLGVWPSYYRKAKGAYIWDLDGNKYIDMSIAGVGANILGYADPDVDNAVKEAIEDGSSCTLNCPEEIELADLLCELHPWADMVRYARSGGESMAIAVRIARGHTGKEKIAFCGYHGWHDWYLSANLSDKGALDGHLMPGLDPIGVPRALTGTAYPFHYNQIEELKKIVVKNANDIAAIVVEPVRNIVPDPDFIKEIKQISTDIHAVFIIDEISAGFRFNTGGAHLSYFPKDCTPDIAVFSKGMGNGYPIAAIIGRSGVMQAAQKAFISSTHWTERIGPKAAIATIEKHKKLDVASHLLEIGGKVQVEWDKVSKKYEISIRIVGSKPLGQFSFEVENPNAIKAYFVQHMLEQGFLASNSFYAMYSHSLEHVDKYSKALDYSFRMIKDAIDSGNVIDKLKGKPAITGFKRLN